MKTPFLPVSDLELFAARYLGLEDDEFEVFYEQYYNLNVDDELEDELNKEKYSYFV